MCILVAVALGLLETSWTGSHQANTALGVLAIFLVFLGVSVPRVWWIPALAILEEQVNYLTAGPAWWNNGQGPDVILHHWSAAFIGLNLFPYVLFPLLTALGEIWMRCRGTALRRWPLHDPQTSPTLASTRRPQRLIFK